MLDQKIRRLLDNKHAVHSVKVVATDQPLGIDRILRVSFSVGYQDLDCVDVEFHSALLPECSVVRCEYDGRDLVTGDAPRITYEHALQLIDHLSKFEVYAAQAILG